MAAIELRELSVRFGSLLAVDALSLTAEGGEVVGLLGPNGAGKTTTVETLEGFRRPDEGTVRVLGLDPVTQHDQLMTRLGVMLQSCRLYSAIRPLEALRLFASYYPQSLDPAALLEQVGLTARADTAWRRLSGGEQQRLALALALVGRPEVVVLDEPTAGLDVQGRFLVRALIAELRAEGLCVLITSHELDEVERMADRVAIVAGGRLLALGTPRELTAGAGVEEIRFSAPSGLVVAELATGLGAQVDEPVAGTFVVALPPSPANVARLTTWLADRDLPLQGLSTGAASLEDVFLRLTGAAAADGGDRP